MTNDFFSDENYKLPETSNYLKFKEGENNFRVLSSAVTGWEYWNKDNKPVRSREAFDEIPEDIKRDKDGNYKINHFWAFVVWNYDAGRIQILELTQKGIMQYIQSLVKNPKWGSPKGYDLTVNRSGAGLDTEYSTIASPHSALPIEISNAFAKSKINLEALFESKDPFAN